MSKAAAAKGWKRWRKFTVAKGAKRLGLKLCEIVGSNPGPTMALVAGQHGMEPTGPAILSALAAELDPAKVRGRILMVPIAYANAIRVCCECEPIRGREKALEKNGRWHNMCPWELNRNECGRNLNRLWPGDPKGTIYERLAAEIWKRAIEPAEYVLDFHCWQDWSPPGALCYGKESLELAKYAGISYLHRNDPHERVHEQKLHVLTAVAVLAGKKALTVEFTPQVNINPDMFALGKRGVTNLMRHVGVLPGRARMTRPLYELGEPVDIKSLKTTRDVLVGPLVRPGEMVEKGRPLATVIPINKPDRATVLKAPCRGLISRVPPVAAVRRGQPMIGMRSVRVLKAKQARIRPKGTYDARA